MTQWDERAYGLEYVLNVLCVPYKHRNEAWAIDIADRALKLIDEGVSPAGAAVLIRRALMVEEK